MHVLVPEQKTNYKYEFTAKKRQPQWLALNRESAGRLFAEKPRYSILRHWPLFSFK
jgi:hypothetical protein